MKKIFAALSLLCCMSIHAAEQLYVFVSFSMPAKTIEDISKLAKKVDGVLVLRGLHNNSFKETAQKINELVAKTNWGMVISPEEYTKFNINAVPAFVLAELDFKGEVKRHDKLAGNVSLDYALREFSKKGELHKEAQLMLQKIARHHG